ncbi:MAG: 50S ribosomal protein L29 [Terracidiphilus sp.]|jgi:large subunit ribosomal protein L29
MELAKIRNLGDEELKHQEKISAEQLFRLRFQVALGQTDGVKKLRQLRKEIAQIKTVARERELGIHGESKEAKPAAEAAEAKTAKSEETVPAAETKAPKARKTAAAAKAKAAKAKKTAAAAETKTAKAKGARK